MKFKNMKGTYYGSPQPQNPMRLVEMMLEIHHRRFPQYVALAPDFHYLQTRPQGEYFLSHIRKLPLPVFNTENEAFEAAHQHNIHNVMVSKAIFSKNVPAISEEGLKRLGWREI